MSILHLCEPLFVCVRNDCAIYVVKSQESHFYRVLLCFSLTCFCKVDEYTVTKVHYLQEYLIPVLCLADINK